MALGEPKHRIPGYIALGLLVTLTTFWTYWGVGEAYFEGWWGAWYNPLLYLLPAIVLLALTLMSIRWPRKGGWTIVIVGGTIFAGWLVISEFTVVNLLKAFLLGGLAALVGVLFLLEARRQRRLHSETCKPPSKWFRRNLPYLLAIGLPFLVTIAFSIYWVPILLGRIDDGDLSARLIEGNGVALVWAPAGPGWYEHYYSWNDIAFYGVPPVGFGEKPGYEDRNATTEDMNTTGLCVYLSEDGLSIMNEPQYIWRMPTVDEIIRSLVRHGENAGCTWDGKSKQANCQILPDKDTPLWTPDWSPIYYWAADEYDEHRAYYVSYNGKGINHQPKSWGNQRHGYRFVREP
ncbi:hypothetical protein ACFLUZ_03650 [Chloroflexota bacterium]